MNIEKFQFISVIVPSGKHPAAALSCGMFFIKIGASYLGRSYFYLRSWRTDSFPVSYTHLGVRQRTARAGAREQPHAGKQGHVLPQAEAIGIAFLVRVHQNQFKMAVALLLHAAHRAPQREGGVPVRDKHHTQQFFRSFRHGKPSFPYVQPFRNARSRSEPSSGGRGFSAARLPNAARRCASSMREAMAAASSGAEPDTMRPLTPSSTCSSTPVQGSVTTGQPRSLSLIHI